jgi:hypothetical protein
LCVEIKAKTTYNIRRTFGKRTNEKSTGESEKVPKAAVASGILFSLAPGTAGGCRKFGIEQNRCAMACQGCDAVFLFLNKKAVETKS